MLIFKNKKKEKFMVNPIKSYSFRALAVLRGVDVDDDDDDDDYIMWRRIEESRVFLAFLFQWPTNTR